MAEFFADGVGWVPVDPSLGHFGGDAGNFLTFHVDPDVTLARTLPNVRAAVREVLDALWDMLSGVCRRHAIAC